METNRLVPLQGGYTPPLYFYLIPNTVTEDVN